MEPAPASVAAAVEPLVRAVLPRGEPTIGLRFWDGSTLGPSDAKATVVLRSPNVIRRLLFAPGELGFGRSYVAGELDIEGDIYAALDLRALMGDTRDKVEVKLDRSTMVDAWKVARKLGVIRRPLAPPCEEIRRLRGRLHTKERDKAAVSHHYNVGNAFYQLFLGATMTYSCAYWAEADMSLDEAQEAKYELVCRKLGLAPGMRLLDVGCGWGGMVMHAARHHGVRAVGITVAHEQAELARRRVAEAGLADRVEIREQDYRDVTDGPFDAVSSIGMFEHVGVENVKIYLRSLFGLLRPKGRLLNHAISSPDTHGGAVPPRSFIGRYVFPDGYLAEVGQLVSAMQDIGFEVRDVESLREHYGRTLRHWVTNLDARWDDAVRLSSPGRARVWRLYMAASAVNFECNRTSIHQVLAARPEDGGASGVPWRRSW